MARIAFIALFALPALACGSPETPPAPTRSSGDMTNRADAHVPNDTPTGDAASPPSPGAPTTTAPSSACAAMAHGECYGSLAAACAAITCPSEMCVATGDRPATVHCQH